MKRAETNIDLLMLKKGIKHDVQIAKDLGLKQQTLSYQLRNDIPMKTLETLANYFGVTVKEMLR